MISRCCVFCSIFLTFVVVAAQAQEVQVNVSGIKSCKGRIVLMIFKDSKSFENTEPYKVFSFKKNGLMHADITLKFNLSIKTFGILLLDDENGNQRMDMTAARIPKEGFGFSNFNMNTSKSPVFSDFKVALSPTNNMVSIKVHYINFNIKKPANL